MASWVNNYIRVLALSILLVIGTHLFNQARSSNHEVRSFSRKHCCEVFSAGSSSGLDGPNPELVLHKRGDGKAICAKGERKAICMRKLLSVDVVTKDYDDVCPNPKHAPRKKPGFKNFP